MDYFEKICKAFCKETKINRSPKKLEEIDKTFKILSKKIKSGDVKASAIGKFVYDNVTNKKIRMQQETSATNFNQFLTTLFKGKIVDKKNRRPEPINYNFGNAELNSRVSRNKLEKMDITLGSLSLSVKTLVPTNKELNIGSFSAEALFRDFLPYTPNEREELGSKALLKRKFEKFKQEEKWNDFIDRFEKMANAIFQTDWIIAIKDKWNLIVYTLKSEEFRKLLVNSLKESSEDDLKFLNRFEGHALRVQVEPIFNVANKTVVRLKGKSTSKLEIIDSAIDKIKFEFMRWIDKEISKARLRKSIGNIVNKLKFS